MPHTAVQATFAEAYRDMVRQQYDSRHLSTAMAPAATAQDLYADPYWDMVRQEHDPGFGQQIASMPTADIEADLATVVNSK